MASKRHSAQFVETFSALKKCLDGVVQKAYARLDLGQAQVRFLRHIGQTAGISQADLARATNTDEALTGRALQTLIERGWVLRERSPKDRRGYLLSLSASGLKALGRIKQARLHLMEKVTAPLDERDLEDFQRIAGKLLSAFGEP
jgi:DNA-binding MarR family transcriptional regulator